MGMMSSDGVAGMAPISNTTSNTRFSTTSVANMNAGMAMGIAGAISSIAGVWGGAKAQKYNMQAQAAIAEANARIAEVNARNAELSAQASFIRGEHEIAALTLRSGQLKSKQRAGLAANGIDLNEGSAAEIQASTEIMKEADMQTIRLNTLREAWGHRTQAKMAHINAKVSAARGQMMSAQASMARPEWQAGLSLIGHAYSVNKKWQAYKRQIAE